MNKGNTKYKISYYTDDSKKELYSQTLLPQVYLKGSSSDKGYILFITKI